MPEASVVIATRDRAGFLRNCLEKLKRQTARGRFEVVVVDNGSSDDTAAAIADASKDGDFIRGVSVADPNRAKARNAGIKSARGDAIIFCDDDTLAPEGFVEAHLRARIAHARAAVAGPILNVADVMHLPSPGPKNYSRAFFCTCNASVARSDLEAVGGFDERYDLYGWEDTDLGVRLKTCGVRRVWSWDAYLYHVKPPNVATLERRISLAREKGAMAARFVRKSPTMSVRLATGAYAANFVRAAIVAPPLLRRWYERAAGADGDDSTLTRIAAIARDALVDAAYVDALRSGLRRHDG